MEKKSGKLSEQEHYNKDGQHNTEYDHEAFLGKQKKTFDQLTLEESKERLGKIVDKIDKDKDGKITKEELGEWIKFTKDQHNEETIDKKWKDVIARLQKVMSRKDASSAKTVDPDGAITWEDHNEVSYGGKPEEELDDMYKGQVKIEKRRWKMADLDQDGKLSREEFSAFYHPWEHEQTHDAVVQETIEDMDKDKDGVLSLKEYLDEVHPRDEKDLTKEQMAQKKADENYFHTNRDINKDGVMDKEEVKEWMFPSNYDAVKSEVSHLIYHADTDKDTMLTKEEILNNHKYFVGSKATNYGKDLTRHEEF